MAPAPEQLVLGKAMSDWKQSLISMGMGAVGGLIGLVIGPWAIGTGAATSVAGMYLGKTMNWKTGLYGLGAGQIGAGIATLDRVGDAGTGVSTASDVESVGGVAWASWIRVKTLDLISDALSSSEGALNWTPASSQSTQPVATTTTTTTTANW